MDGIKLGGTKKNMSLNLKILMKNVDLGEPTSIPRPNLFGLHSGNAKELTKVLGADEETKSHVH